MDSKQAKISLWQLAMISLYIGATGYGGPAIVGNMKQIFVDRKKLLSEDDFLTGLSLSQMLPSATGANTIEFIGYKVGGWMGALIAPLFFVIPTTVLMTILSAIYFAYGEVSFVKELFTGLGAVVVALIVNATITLGKTIIKGWGAAVIAIIGFTIVQVLHGPIWSVILASALTGLLVFRRSAPDFDDSDRGANHANGESKIFWLWFTLVIAVITAALVLTYNIAATRFITVMLKIGAQTFGGGFMAIPIFQHEAVTIQHWLTTRQFMDGIALGQITPGPVLITANFIGYKVFGLWGSIVGSIAVFTPGIIGMFVLAHQHEKVSHLGWLQHMVKGIVSGFIGVLLTVTIRLGMHSLFDWKTISLFLASLAVLLVAKKDPLWVIIGGALVSLLLFR